MMTPLRLSIHGIAVELLCREAAVLSDLARDFAYFTCAGAPPDAWAGEPAIRLELRPWLPPRRRLPGWTPLVWRSARIAHREGVRQVDYEGGKALLEYDLRQERGVLYAREAALLHELAYLTVLSRAGERLDRRRLHRVHALGFAYRERGGILLLPSGGGKSRLALELLGREGFQLLADDIPLLDRSGRRLVSFPLRLGLRGEDWRGIPDRHLRLMRRRRFGDKRLVDLAYFRDKVAAGAPLAWILAGEPAREGQSLGPRLQPCSAARAAAAMLLPLVLGVGTPQILELMLPAPPWIPGALRLLGIASARLGTALRAATLARCARLRLGRNARENVDVIEEFLKNNNDFYPPPTKPRPSPGGRDAGLCPPTEGKATPEDKVTTG